MTRLGFSIVWCFDGVKSEDKLATDKRKDRKEDDLLYILALYSILRQDDRGSGSIEPYVHILEPLMRAIPPEEIASEAKEVKVSDRLVPKLHAKLTSCPLFPPNMTTITYNMMKTNGCPCFRIDEISEGEKLCSILSKAGIVDAVYSPDGDCVPLGASVIIRKVDIEKDEVHLHLISEIKQFLNLSQERIIDLCIMLGTDFNKRVTGRGIVKSLKKINEPSFNIDTYEAEFGKEIVRVAICKKFFSITEEDMKHASFRF